MKLDRMIGILSVLLQTDTVTAPELAQRFEVSRRTILRDVDALGRAGIPIVARQGNNGGFSIMEGYRVDRTVLTRSEMQAILTGLRSLDSVSGTRRYARLMEKLSAQPPDMLQADSRILIDLSSWCREPISEKIGLIRGAMEASRRIGFCYHGPRGDSRRDVEPCYLVFQWASWYVYGWCTLRQDWRLFKLNRMTDLRVLGAFEHRDAPIPDFSAQQVFPERWRAVVLIEPRYRWRLIEEYGPECYSETEDGRLRFEGGFANRDQLITWLLSFEDGAELLEPAELRREIGEIGRAIREKYNTGGKS